MAHVTLIHWKATEFKERADDLTQTDVRRIGLATGLVDYKICAIDETWSAL